MPTTRDMQEDKECVFNAADTLIACIKIFTAMIKTATWNKKRMYESASKGFTNATDAADYLVKKGMPFRDAHSVIGHIVLACEKKGIGISDLTLDELKEFSELFAEDVYTAISLETCVNTRKIIGAPAKEFTQKHIKILQEFLKTV